MYGILRKILRMLGTGLGNTTRTGVSFANSYPSYESGSTQPNHLMKMDVLFLHKLGIAKRTARDGEVATTGMS